MKSVKRSRQSYLLLELEKDGATYQVLKSDQQTDLKVLELFAGAGGMALGFENAGLKTMGLVEKNKHCVETLKHNQPNWDVMATDVLDIDYTQYANEIDILSGGVPCQSYSSLGKQLGLRDPRGKAIYKYFKALREINPKIFLIENVMGFIKPEKGSLRLIEELFGPKYDIYYELLNAQYFDVPQKRKRVFIIGVRKDLGVKYEFPQPNNYVLTLRQALENCPESDGIRYHPLHEELFNKLTPGESLSCDPLNLNGGKREATKYKYKALRLSWDKPAYTITGNPHTGFRGYCHPQETRPLKTRECARLQTFPDEWEFQGARRAIYEQIGNAVPVNLAFHIGRSLINVLT